MSSVSLSIPYSRMEALSHQEIGQPGENWVDNARYRPPILLGVIDFTNTFAKNCELGRASVVGLL